MYTLFIYPKTRSQGQIHLVQIQNEENKKTKNITQKTTNISNMNPTKAPGLWCYSQSCKSIVGDRVKKRHNISFAGDNNVHVIHISENEKPRPNSSRPGYFTWLANRDIRTPSLWTIWDFQHALSSLQ
jgi:hypothetical protein